MGSLKPEKYITQGEINKLKIYACQFRTEAWNEKYLVKMFWGNKFKSTNFQNGWQGNKKKQKGISQYPKKPLNFHWARPTQSANQSVCCQSGVFDDVRDQYAWRISLVIWGRNLRVLVGFCNQNLSITLWNERNLDLISMLKPTLGCFDALAAE